MPDEFLSRLAGIQGKGMFSGSIQAKGQAVETAGITAATNVMNQAAQEIAILSGSAEMKTTDEKIEELSKMPDVMKSSKDAQMLTERVARLQEAVEEKREVFSDVYRRASASLLGIGGETATRGANIIARQQDLTNKELDSKIDEINLQVGRQAAYDSAVINDKKLLQIEADEEHSRLTNIGMESFLADPAYQELQDTYFDKANKKELERYEALKSALIEKHFGPLKQTENGMTRKILEDSFGVANLYSGKYGKNRPGPQDPESMNKLKIATEYVKTTTALIAQAGGIDDVMRAIRTPKEYWVQGGLDKEGKEPLIKQGSMLHNRLIEALGGKPGQSTLYDKAMRDIATFKPEFGKMKNIQNEIRKSVWDESTAVVPPILDVPTWAPEDPDLNDVIIFNGSSLLGHVTYDPMKVESHRESLREALADPATFGRVKEPEGVFPKEYYYSIGRLSPDVGGKVAELVAYQKITNAARALAKDGVTKDEQAEFDQQRSLRDKEYASRKDPVTGKPMNYIEPVAGVRSNVDLEKSNLPAIKSMMRWEPTIVGASSQYELKQDTLRSVIHHESGYGNEFAVSDTDVQGLAQITGDTLEDIVNTFKLTPRDWSVADIRKDPKKTVYAGASYLKYIEGIFVDAGLRDEDKLDTATVLGYNAGPDRAMQMYRYGLLDFIKVGIADPKIHTYLQDQRKPFNKEYGLNITPKRWNEMIKFPSTVNRDYNRDFVTKTKG